MDKSKLNSSPVLTMAERMKQLFNNPFLSDVQFLIGDRSVYAHSLQLMACSTVFQKQFEMTLGEKKLILIDDVSYDSVYQFVRFIYKDDVDATDANVIDILKLSKRYKVIKLENEIFSYITSVGLWLKLYEYCVLEHDELHTRRSWATIVKNMKKVLSTEEFLTIHPNVVEEILKSNFSNASEIEMFTALTRWIGQHTNDNNVAVCPAIYYEKYIRLIRFPVMTVEQIIQCTRDYPHLFHDRDYTTIFKTLGDNNPIERVLWNPQPRQILNYTFQSNNNCETQFTVSRTMLLTGLRFGNHQDSTLIEIKFTHLDTAGVPVDQIKMDCKPSPWVSVVLNLGEIIKLIPRHEYIIEVNNYKEAILPFARKLSKSFSRDQNTDVFINISEHFIRFSKLGTNIIDIYFKVIE